MMKHSKHIVPAGRGKILVSMFLMVMLIFLLAVSCSDFIDVMRGGTVSFESDYGDPPDEAFVLGRCRSLR